MTSWPLEVVAEIGSTSDALIGRAATGERGPLGLLAHRQTSGRGRRGRTWTLSRGLAISVLLRPAWQSENVGWAVFAAGLALLEGLQRFVTDGRRLMLRWPNDVLLDGGKLGGILVESAIDGNGAVDWLVIGAGANLEDAPEVAGRPTASLAMCSVAVPTPEQAGTAVMTALERWIGTLDRDGFEPARQAWLDAAYPAGTRVTVGGVDGRFAGVTAAGHLLLAVGSEVRSFSSGDVVLAGA